MSSLKDMGPMSLGQLHDALTPEWHPRDTEAHAKQINTALDSERAFRGNFRYIETKE